MMLCGHCGGSGLNPNSGYRCDACNGTGWHHWSNSIGFVLFVLCMCFWGWVIWRLIH